jgi:hydroxyethylthiazole kinase
MGTVGTLHAAVVEGTPLVHCVTNVVTAGFVANALLALGASPAMVEDPEEAGELAAVAGAVVVNTGTMSAVRADGMRAAADAARRAGTPWLLDPVAVGAVTMRSRVAADLLTRGPTAVRGNASEVMSLAGTGAGGRGVDATAAVDEAAAGADALARRTGAVVAVSGPDDAVTDGSERHRVGGGDPVMGRVTGMGCALGALTGAFLAVAPARGLRPLDAVVAASALVGATGQDAAARSAGPGTFVPAWLDQLADPDLERAEHLADAP